jgi:hypothetical protein
MDVNYHQESWQYQVMAEGEVVRPGGTSPAAPDLDPWWADGAFLALNPSMGDKCVFAKTATLLHWLCPFENVNDRQIAWQIAAEATAFPCRIVKKQRPLKALPSLMKIFAGRCQSVIFKESE